MRSISVGPSVVKQDWPSNSTHAHGSLECTEMQEELLHREHMNSSGFEFQVRVLNAQHALVVSSWV